jgi:hypothetical protein
VSYEDAFCQCSDKAIALYRKWRGDTAIAGCEWRQEEQPSVTEGLLKFRADPHVM